MGRKFFENHSNCVTWVKSKMKVNLIPYQVPRRIQAIFDRLKKEGKVDDGDRPVH